ncbi:MAG: PCRF domain-containing protein, partial [Proteobacteria bacterium]|nr:PCRF domain-containing protein [Pseudomonadota bacterium]
MKRILNQIEVFLARPDSYSDPNFASKAKRASTLREIIELDNKIKAEENNLTEAETLLDDPELGEIAKADIENLKVSIPELKARLEELLIPRAPEDDKPAIFEIRAGAGGDEASLFGGELYRLYLKYAERHGLKFE